MRATDIVRQVLDLIDQVEGVELDSNDELDVQRVTNDDDPSRFRQILALLDKGEQMPYGNTPNEIVADVDAVTTLAGGGVNGPKHPADIRVKDPTDYPVR